jgi:hypothetical protein
MKGNGIRTWECISGSPEIMSKDIITDASIHMDVISNDGLMPILLL